MNLKGLMYFTLLVFVLGATFTLVTSNVPIAHAHPFSDNWTTYGYDATHDNFNPNEEMLNKQTVANLKLKWSQLTAGSISAQPIEANNVVYWGSWDGFEHASTASGKPIWNTRIGQTTDNNCYPPTVGVASTATFGRIGSTPAIFVGGGNATFYALNANTGMVIWSTSLGVSPSHFIWDSPMMVRGSIYIAVSSFGDCPLVQGKLFKINAKTGNIQSTFSAVPDGCTGAGIWGSPTLGKPGNVLYIATGNSGSCSNYEPYAWALVELRTSDLSVVRSWQVPIDQQTRDGDFGSTPNVFNVTSRGHTYSYVGVINKNGIYYTFNSSNIAAGPVWETKVAVDVINDCPQCGDGSVSPSAWDGHILYIAGGNTTINNTNCPGSVSAINPLTGAFIWRSCLTSGPVLGSVTVIPGVVIVSEGNRLDMINAATGTTIFNFSDNKNVFYGAASVSYGTVFVGNMDGNLYALGL